MDWMFMAAWVASGVLGGLLIWFNWAREFNEWWFSPARIFLIIASGLGGPAIFATGVAMLIGDAIERAGVGTWWTRPIGRGRR